MSETTNKNYINFNMNEEALALDLHSRLQQKESCEEKFLPLYDKVMWCKSKFPFSYNEYKILMSTESCALVEAIIYTESGENGKIIGRAIASADSSQLTKFASVDANKVALIKLAYGSALTRAYTNAGFGLQFRGDSFEAELEALKKERQDMLENKTLDMNSMKVQENIESGQEIAEVLNTTVSNSTAENVAVDNAAEDNTLEETSVESQTAETAEEPKKKPKTARAKKDVSQIVNPKAPENNDIPAPQETEPSNISSEEAAIDVEGEETDEALISAAEAVTEQDINLDDTTENEQNDILEEGDVNLTSEEAIDNDVNAETVADSFVLLDNIDDELPFQNDPSESEVDVPESNEPKEMTLDEARNVEIDFGNHIRGTTIGANEINRPSNLTFIYNNGSDIHKQAVLVIARNNEQIKKLLISKGIPV